MKKLLKWIVSQSYDMTDAVLSSDAYLCNEENNISRVEWERIRGPAAPMHLGRRNGPSVHRF
jgi:hypothetical protein